MPSRLGDDPLARAGKGSAKPNSQADVVASPVALDSFGGPAASQPEIRSDSNIATIALQRSYNDVFFLRRGESSSPSPNEVQQTIEEPVETREISEVFEIPEMREVAAASIFGSDRDAAAVAEPSQPQEVEEDVGAQGAVALTSPETVVAVETGVPVAEPARHVEAPTAQSQEPIVLPAPDPNQSDRTEPEEGGGFVKKFFDKLGK